ncbi:MAG: CinA family protein [Promethearchaeota archaeon]
MILKKYMNKFFIKLKSQKIKLLIAESATGGLFSHLFTNISGSSEVLLADIVCYSPISKTLLLDVPVDIINKFGMVSEETAIGLLEGLNKIKEKIQENTNFKSYKFLLICITGIAGAPIENKPKGLFYIGISYKNKKKILKFQLKGNRKRLKYKAVKLAIKNILQIVAAEKIN